MTQQMSAAAQATQGDPSITAAQAPDPAKTQAFLGKALGDLAGHMTSIQCALGDRLGLFRDLAEHGPTTSTELAARAVVNERYAREWLAGLATAGYLTYEPASGRFTLPPEHAPVLADEGGPYFFGGIYQMLPPMVAVFDQLARAFRSGGGVAQAAYGDAFWDGLERLTGTAVENQLVPLWIAEMHDVGAKLARGARVADVGCGRGRALIKLAQAFPAGTYVGYDSFAPTVARATAAARAAGVENRVRFEHRDVGEGLPEQYDVITTFDVIHDAVDPLRVLQAIRKALKPDGVYVCQEINCAERLEDNAGPVGALLHGLSLLYCMTTSLAGGGAGLGTLGLPETALKRLGLESGFSEVRRLPIEDPFNSVFEIRP